MDSDPQSQRIQALEQLLEVQEEIALRQTRALEDAMARLRAETQRLQHSEEALRQSEARKQAIVEASMDAMITIDGEGRVRDINRAAEVLFGYPRDFAIGRDMADMIIPERFREAHRRGMARYLDTGESTILNQRLQLPAVRADRLEFTCELTIAVVHGLDEVLFIGQVRDITQQQRDAQQLRHLQMITDAALASLSLDDLLPELVRRLQVMLESDSVAIMLLVDDETLELRAGIGLEVPKGEPYRLPIGTGIAGRIARAVTSLQIEDIETVEGVSPVLFESNIKSVLGAPMLVGNKLIGVVHVGAHQRRHFTPGEVNLLERVAARISLAVEHARSFEREQRISQTLQMSLLPSKVGGQGLDLHVRYRPSEEAARVGGDWYDVLELEKGLVAFEIGDVMGHGTQSAAAMGQFRWALRSYMMEDPDPARALSRVNRLMHGSGTRELATVSLAVFDPDSRVLRYANAGHPPPLLLCPKGEHRFLNDARGPVIGAKADAEFQLAEIALGPGEGLLFYTDGLIEVAGTDIAESMEHLRELIPGRSASVHEIAAVIDQALPPAGRSNDDDAAYLIVRPD